MAAELTLAKQVARVRLAAAEVRREDVELALWHHLSAIGAETDNFVWEPDLEHGFETVRDRLRHDQRVWTPSIARVSDFLCVRAVGLRNGFECEQC
jgi:hypothetical protein